MADKVKIYFLTGKEEPQPKDIKKLAGTRAVGFFGKFEIEQAAGKLVEYLTYRGQGWKPFQLKDLYHFYMTSGWLVDDFLLGLLGTWMDEDGSFCQPDDYLLNNGSEIVMTTLFLERLQR